MLDTIAQQQTPPTASPDSKAPRLLDHLREKIRAKHYSPRTAKVYVYWCRWFIRHNDRRHPLAGSTRNRVINLLTAVLNCAVAAGWIAKVPNMARVKSKDSRTRWLTLEEWQRLERGLPCHLRQMARFALATGLRENNVIGLEWSQIDLDRRVAWIHPDQTKGGKALGVPLSDAALRVLEAQAGLHPQWVFVWNGKPVTKTSTKSWKAALVRAGIDVCKDGQGRDTSSFRWHDLRHTWASWHVMNGTPLEVLQKLGGWRTLQMVLRYAHLAPEHLAQYADNAAPRQLMGHISA